MTTTTWEFTFTGLDAKLKLEYYVWEDDLAQYLESNGEANPLKVTDGKSPTGTKVYGDVVFVDGVAQFRLGNGDSTLMTDIPSEYKFTVTEVALELKLVLSTRSQKVNVTILHLIKYRIQISDTVYFY